MKRFVIIGIVLILAALCVLLAIDRPDPPVPTGNPTTIVPRPPLLPQGPQVAVADTSGNIEVVSVEDGDDVAATVTVASPPDSIEAHPVQLLVDRPEAEWFPEVDLVRTEIRIRTLDPFDAPLVTVVHQRMSIVDVEFLLFGGAGYRENLSAVAGVTLVRVWFVHAGVGATYNKHEGLQVDLPVALELRPRLLAGIMPFSRTAFLAYRF